MVLSMFSLVVVKNSFKKQEPNKGLIYIFFFYLSCYHFSCALKDYYSEASTIICSLDTQLMNNIQRRQSPYRKGYEDEC